MFSSESHRNPRPDAPFSPDFDLRETTDAYFLEGEFPGISGRGAVKMQWLDGRTLRIEGRIQKLDLNEAGEVILVRGQERKEERENSQEKASALRTWLNERRAGLFVRNFSFPAGLDIDRIQARLSQGLLRVMIPKTRRERFESREIYVQTPDDSLV
ncbi:HSP20-like chaperone [Lojkania enalia]|uniref:HSP20-like chaperone n=1 Tax=Lojkania enalia TaxID=147567 RepID=A0A9P4K2G2_9PLEO|nr:HSP20-like chaperone [Didymosphaeria enalia]